MARRKKGESPLCKCGLPRRGPGQRQCKDCHAAAQKKSREKFRQLIEVAEKIVAANSN